MEAITTYFYNGVIAGFANHYVLDYGTRREIALSVDEQWLLETEGVQEAQFDVPAGALIVKVSGSVSDIGITQITFTLDNGEEYSFGEKQPDEEL